MITDPTSSHDHIWVLLASAAGALAALINEVRAAGWVCNRSACIRALYKSFIALFAGWVSGLFASGAGLSMDLVAGLSGLGAYYSMATLQLLHDLAENRLKVRDGEQKDDEQNGS